MIAAGARGRAARSALRALCLCAGVGSAGAGERHPGGSAPDVGPVLRSAGLEIRLPRTREGGDGVHTYDLEMDAVTPAAQSRLGGRSGLLRLSIDCRRSLFRAERLSVFAGPQRSGPLEEVRLPNEWVRGVRGTYLPALSARLCDTDDAAAASGRETTSAPPAAPGNNATVQLGSFKSEAAAELAWTDMARRDKAAGRRPHQVEAARVGQTRAYRLLAAAQTAEEANALCRRMRAARRPCLVRQAPSP